MFTFREFGKGLRSGNVRRGIDRNRTIELYLQSAASVDLSLTAKCIQPRQTFASIKIDEEFLRGGLTSILI
ncbi:hypothetical protein C0J52_11572 [Blattella germanica]|nr:hypothetical protein C0J52_11572 [Blattella germanica]